MEEKKIITERNVIIEVLEKYRQLPFLWNPTHKLYTNKLSRRQGLEIMLRSWRKLEPKANLDCLRKKLNNWRAAYRRERKKVEASMADASEPDEIHKPNLWYYDYLTFINDDCPVLSKDDDGGGNVSDIIGGDDDDDDDEGGIECVDANGGDNDGEGRSGNGEDDEDDSEEEPEKKPRISFKRKNKERKQEQTVDPAHASTHSNDETSADWFGRAIGSQLKDVSKFQRCLAEKLISEIMFYAKLEQLTISSSIRLESSDS